MADMRPILLGMNNPLSRDPRHALFPSPPGCTGHRILEMLRERRTVTISQYLRAFDRRNLVSGERWSSARGSAGADELVRELMGSGRTVVVLGSETRRALGLERVLIHPVTAHGVHWRQLPHPSGRNLWYNDPACRALAADLLAELYDSSTGAST